MVLVNYSINWEDICLSGRLYTVDLWGKCYVCKKNRCGCVYLANKANDLI
jgi:hypothetical protein